MSTVLGQSYILHIRQMVAHQWNLFFSSFFQTRIRSLETDIGTSLQNIWSNFQHKWFSGLFIHQTQKKLIHVRFWKRRSRMKKGKFTIPWTTDCVVYINCLWTSFKILILLWQHASETPFPNTSLSYYLCGFTPHPSNSFQFIKTSHLLSSHSSQRTTVLFLGFDQSALVCPINPFSLGGSQHILADFTALKKKRGEESYSWYLLWICFCFILCVSLLCSVLCIRRKAIILPEMYL